MKKLMKNAWEIAQKSAKRFGGKASQYIAMAMKEAWVIKKTNESYEFAQRVEDSLEVVQVIVVGNKSRVVVNGNRATEWKSGYNAHDVASYLRDTFICPIDHKNFDKAVDVFCPVKL